LQILKSNANVTFGFGVWLRLWNLQIWVLVWIWRDLAFDARKRLEFFLEFGANLAGFGLNLAKKNFVISRLNFARARLNLGKTNFILLLNLQIFGQI